MLCPERLPLRAAAALLVLASLPASARAAGMHPAGPQEGEARIPVRVLGGKLVARCQLSSPTTSAPVNLWIALDKPCGLELHNKVANPLNIEKPDGTTVPLAIEFPGLDIEVERRQHGDEPLMEDFTKRYAPKMEEVALSGTLGSKLLADYVVTLDLARDQVRLRRPTTIPGVPRTDPASEAPREGAAAGDLRAPRAPMPTGPEDVYLPCTVAGDVVWIAAELAGGQRRMLGLGTSRYDSVIDEETCFELDEPGGRVGPVLVGGFDLSEVVAWRPEPYDLVHRDGAVATLGLGFLRSFRVEIDAVNGWVGLTRYAENPFPAEEADYFEARAEEEAEPLAAWLGEHGDTRLASEAAALLLQMQVDEGAPSDEVRPALEALHCAQPDDLRTTEALDSVDLLVQARRPDLAVVAGRLGLEGGRNDRYPESVHRLHVRIGELLLEDGDDRGAWEHLMSAAFGLTESVGSAERAKVNLLLGRCYERQGKYRRAMSRYVQAVLSPEFGPQALPAIEALQPRLGGETFSVDLVEKLISGKTRSMTAPTTFEVDGATDTNRCVLVEHFVNPHIGRKQGELWQAFTEGGSMAFEALQTHFPRERVALLSYHGDTPRPVALMNALSLRETERADLGPAFTIDGRMVAQGVCRYWDADGLYQKVRDAALVQLAEPSAFELELEARLDGELVRGVVRVRGPEKRGTRIHLVLAERGVVYPGLGATVIHRMVARGVLTPELGGLEWQPDGTGQLAFEFERSVSELEAANVAFLEDYEASGGSPASRLSTHIDPHQLTVVAFLRDPFTRTVFQAAQVDVPVDREAIR